MIPLCWIMNETFDLVDWQLAAQIILYVCYQALILEPNKKGFLLRHETLVWLPWVLLTVSHTV